MHYVPFLHLSLSGRRQRQAGSREAGVSPRIVLVDAGMVAQLTRTEQDNFIGLLQAFGRGDGARAAQCLLRFSDSQVTPTPIRVTICNGSWCLLRFSDCEVPLSLRPYRALHPTPCTLTPKPEARKPR